MIPLEVLKSQSLFSLLYMIDHDLCEHTRAKNCPFAGVHCIAPTTNESLDVGPRIFKRRLSFDSAFAAAVRVAVDVCCRLRFGFGIAGFTGRLCYCWSAPFARDKNPQLLWSVSRLFAGYGVQLSSAGNTTFENFLFRTSATGDCPGGCCLPSIRTNCPGRYCPVLSQTDLRRHWRTAYGHLP
jgi:hypothetical protein